jgi:hypothetical protein
MNREALAHKVAAGFQALKDIEDDVRRLWAEFDSLADGETIMGYHTKTEYCESVLGRTMRSVRYMLAGGNHQRGETVSPIDRDVPPVDRDVLDVVYEKVAAFVCGERVNHPVQSLPALADMLTKGRTLTAAELETLDAIITSLRNISDLTNDYHFKLMGLRPVAKAA